MSSDNDEIKKEIITSFHTQFAENQNHHQKLLVSFVSAITIVVVGYAFVFSKADFNGISKDGFSYFHLFISNLLSQIILSLICSININIGYGFRRDQQVNEKTRRKYLKEEYSEIFGENTFKASGKSLNEYLPNFNLIIFLFLNGVQFVIALSIFPFSKNSQLIPSFILFLPICLNYFVFKKYYEIYSKNVKEVEKTGNKDKE